MWPTLFKKDTTGAIRQWHIEVHDSLTAYRMVSGQLHGQLVASDWTAAQSTNVGKKHERGPIDQCKFEVEAAYKKKRKEGYHDTIEAAQTEKMHFFEPMLAKDFKKYETQLPWRLGKEGSVFVQPKLDGIRCISHRGDLRSRTGEHIPSCGHIASILSNLPEGIYFDGELYNHDLREDFNTIASLVRKTKGYEAVQDQINKTIQYHIYDVFLSARPDATFEERYRWLHQFFVNNPTLFPAIQFVKTWSVNNDTNLDECYGLATGEGYEGGIIRFNAPYENKRTSALLKRKEFQDAEFEILDVLEGVGNRSGMAGSLMLRLADGRPFQSGIKGGRDHYRFLLAKRDQFVGQRATIRYFHLTPDGIPRFPVCVDIGRKD
jgi:DNA ligase-1